MTGSGALPVTPRTLSWPAKATPNPDNLVALLSHCRAWNCSAKAPTALSGYLALAGHGSGKHVRRDTDEPDAAAAGCAASCIALWSDTPRAQSNQAGTFGELPHLMALQAEELARTETGQSRGAESRRATGEA